jgi:hypothetical protein
MNIFLIEHQSFNRLGGLTWLLLAAEVIAQESPAVFVFVAINAEVLPVGAVGGIIMVVAVLMVHR